jgi:hypothetical protein
MSEDSFGALLRAARKDRRPPAQLARNVLDEYLAFIGRQERRAARREAPPVAAIEVHA